MGDSGHRKPPRKRVQAEPCCADGGPHMQDRSTVSNDGAGTQAARCSRKRNAAETAAALESEPWREQAYSPQDDAYRGSRFSEVRAAMFENPYQRVWGSTAEPPLPIYPVRLRDLI